MKNIYFKKRISDLLAINRYRLVVLILLSLVVLSPLMAQQDTTPPVLNNFSISPTEIDVTEGEDTVEVAISVKDTNYGLRSITVYFESPFGSDRVSLNYSDLGDAAMSYTGTDSAVIPQFVEPGEWTLDYIQIRYYTWIDTVGGGWIATGHNYYPSDLDTMGFSYTFNVVSIEDSLPPILAAFLISSSEIDVTSGNDSIAVSFTVEDDVSGLSYFSVRFKSPSSYLQTTGFSSYQLSDWNSGDLSYTGTGYLVIEQFWESGEWELDYIYLTDQMSNDIYYYSDDLENMGFPTTFTVISEDDSLPPELTHFDIFPREIDVVEGSDLDTINVSISVSDNLSGLDRVVIYFRSPSGGYIFGPTFSDWNSGAMSYTGTGVITVHNSMEIGKWILADIRLKDEVGNERYYYSTDLENMGFPVSFIYGYGGPVFHVSTDGDDINGIGSAEAPFATIQKGIDSATDGDTVLVDTGTYVENINFNGKNLVLGSLFLVTGDTYYISQTVIDGGSSGSVVRFNNGEDSSAVLCGFTIQKGKAHKGGGMNFYGEVSPIIQHCIIQNNIAEQRYLENGYGGGIYCNNGPDPRFIKCIIRNNIAESYEGMGGQGGGAYIRNNFGDIGNPRFIKTLIYGNIADPGTSIDSWGGGLYFFNSIPEILNCTISNNMAGFGGGIKVARSGIHLVNSILWGNSNDQIDIDQTDPDSGFVAFSNIQGGETGVDGFLIWLEGNIDTDPQFVDTLDGDFHLQEGSPCIDAGTALFVWEGDTLVDFSPDDYVGSAPDMGAFEFGSVSISQSEDIVPQRFALHQNYPNPFNPRTTIRFGLPETQQVKLVVYNLLGQEVITLLDNEFKEAGYHEVVLNAGRFSSGVYFYRIKAGKWIETRKMVVIK